MSRNGLTVFDQPRRGRSPLPGVAGLSLAALLIALTAGCGRPEAQASARAAAVPVVVETVGRRDVPAVAELAARAEASATVDIRANVEGRLTAMSFKEGRLVHKGQALFLIDPRHYAAAMQVAGAVVEKAEADLEMAREQKHLVNAQSVLRQAEANLLKSNQDVERLKPLAARHAVPARDLDTAIAAQSSAGAAVEDARATVRTTAVGDRMGLRQAQASLTAARAALDTAAMDLAETDIRAPIDGLIGRAQVSVGNYVGRGESSRLATISKVDPINVVFGLSETLYLQTVNTVKPAELERIELVLSDNSVYPFRGRYTSIASALDEKSGTLLAVAQFPNPKGLLLPGMTGRVHLVVGVRQDAVLVSERAVLDVQGSKSVYVVTSGNKVELRSVAIEGSYQNRRIVTAGLRGGETVVVAGGAKLRPGQLVTPHTAQSRHGKANP